MSFLSHCLTGAIHKQNTPEWESIYAKGAGSCCDVVFDYPDGAAARENGWVCSSKHTVLIALQVAQKPFLSWFARNGFVIKPGRC